MTVDHGQADVAFHRHPTGDVLFTLPVEAFGYDPEDTFVEWMGGYLTPETAVVALGSESEDGEEWFRFHLIDVRTGTISGDMAVEAAHADEMEPLGDGSWLTDGPVRWFRTPLPTAPPHAASRLRHGIKDRTTGPAQAIRSRIHTPASFNAPGSAHAPPEHVPGSKTAPLRTSSE